MDSVDHLSESDNMTKKLKRFIRFCLVGASGYVSQFGVFWLLTRYVGLYDLVAHIPSIEASVLSNFVLNDNWTFRDRRTEPLPKRLIRYHLICLGYAVFFYVGYVPLTRYLGWYDLWAWLVASLIGLAWNFGMNLLWTWPKR